MRARRDGDSPKNRGRGRPLGSIVVAVLFILVVLIALHNRLGDSADDKKLSVEQFHEKLYAGEIERFTVDTDGAVQGELHATRGEAPPVEPGGALPSAKRRGGDRARQGFTLYYPEAKEKLGELSRKLRHLDPSSPWDPESLLARLQSGEVTPLEAVLLSRVEDSGEKRMRLFVELIDREAHRYVEVVPKKGEAFDVHAVVARLREKGAALDTPVFSATGGVNAAASNTLFNTLITLFAPWLLIILFFWFFIGRQMRAPGAGGGVLGFGRSRAVLYTKENRTNVTFDDVAGIDEAKEEVKELIEFLKNPQRFTRLGGRIPRGILLVGPPGTGKTLLAKAIAGEAEVPFFSISGSDFVEMFVGVGASRVRDLFKQAKENAPCIIFLDEIDAVGRKRGSGLHGGHDEREQTLNAILVEMDGFDTNEGIIVCAATNRPDVLDPALLRPGRFDREVVIDLPDYKGREEILKVHARRVKLGPDVDLHTIARSTPAFSGADLAALMNEAAIIAVLRKREAVAHDDLEEARDKVRFGRQKKSRVVAEEDRIVTARHESGHAVAAALLPGAEPVHKVTIIPRGMALGATMRLPEKDQLNFAKKRAEAELSVLYGGRIAEELMGDDISSGASNDIARATELARLMVCEWGFSPKVGPLRYAEKVGSDFLGSELAAGRFHSEVTAREIDEEVRKICQSAYDRTRKLLEERIVDLQRVAAGLLQYETITGSELSAILAGRPIESLRPEGTAAAAPPAVQPAGAKPRAEARPSPGYAPPVSEGGLSPA
jgi:cell division protease FtsH